MSSKFTLVTVVLIDGDLSVKVTQRYNPQYDWGHWHYVVENDKGDIVSAGSSSGAPPHGKVDEEWCRNRLVDYRRMRRFDDEE